MRSRWARARLGGGNGRSGGRFARLKDKLARLEERGLQRELRTLDMDTPTTGRLDGKRVTVFCSNDYLGLARNPEVLGSWRGGGTGSARRLAGNPPAHMELEAELTRRYEAPATLFSSGWHANMALLTTVLEPGDVVASDQLNHASIIDALRLSGADKAIVPHGSTALPPGCRAHVVEGLYSMEGTVPDLRAARAACDAAGAWLIVDEAHAVGVIGPDGKGSCAEQGVSPDFLVGTLGKAYGCFGAFVVGPPVLHDLLVSAGRTFVFTTGLPEGAATAAMTALRLADHARRHLLLQNVSRLRQGLTARGIRALGTEHIVPVVLGPATLQVAERLLEQGFYVPGIRAPTVPEGQERLRITVSAAHLPSHVDGLLHALDRALDRRR